MKRLLVLFVLVAAACSGTPQGIEVSNARVWVPPGSTTAAYFDLTNHGPGDDTLVGVESDIARAMVHRTMMQDGQMMMQPAGPVAVPVGETVSFAPGGLHVMLMDVPPLGVGDTVELRLLFEQAGTVTVEVPVVEIETP